MTYISECDWFYIFEEFPWMPYMWQFEIIWDIIINFHNINFINHNNEELTSVLESLI